MKSRRITRKQSALRQIHAAIKLFHEEEYESAVTLALAAESQLPHADVPYLYDQLKARVSSEETDMFNLLRNWLKHIIPPDEVEITDFDAVIALMRATSKFIAVFRESTTTIENFIEWCRERGHISPKGGGDRVS